MPKLSKKQAQTVDKSEAWAGRELLPDGLYLARLFVVSVEPKKPGGKADSWKWEYQLISDLDGDDTHANRKINDWTSLSEEAAGKLKQVFQAFEADVDTDTDELLGATVCLRIGHRTQTQGANAGNVLNTVVQVLSAEAAGAELEEEDPVTAEDF